MSAANLRQTWQQRLGWAVREARRARGWSRERLAQVAGYDVQAIAKIERGRSVRLSTLCDVAEALALSVPGQVRG